MGRMPQLNTKPLLALFGRPGDQVRYDTLVGVTPAQQAEATLSSVQGYQDHAKSR